MADCGLRLSEGILSSDKDKPLHYTGQSIFFDEFETAVAAAVVATGLSLCLPVCLSVSLSVCAEGSNLWSEAKCRSQRKPHAPATPVIIWGKIVD